MGLFYISDQSLCIQVLASVNESIKVISKVRGVVVKIRSKLIKTSSYFSDLEQAIDNASNDLEGACSKTLAGALMQLDELSSEYREGLNKNKDAAADIRALIQNSSARRNDIVKMKMNELLQFYSELKKVSSLAEDFLLTGKGLYKEESPLGAELSKRYSSVGIFFSKASTQFTGNLWLHFYHFLAYLPTSEPFLA